MIVLMLVPNVLAESVINFNSTANFDAGTKTNVGTISDDCTVASNTFQILTSVGTNGINSNCIIGSPKVATTGIKISYDMETLASGKMKDFSGSGYDGTISGTTSVSGKFGNARSFSGVATDYITVASVADLSGWTTVSVSAWAKTSIAQTTIIASKHGGGTGGEWFLEVVSGVPNQIQFTAINTVPTRINCAQTFANAFDGNWHQYTGTYDGANINVYADGSFLGSCALTGALQTTTNAIYVGTYAGLLFNFNGVIDNLLIFKNRVLTLSEIGNLYSAFARYSNGFWKSAIQTFTGEVVNEITVHWSGISTTKYVKGIAIVNGIGNVLFNNTTAFKTGTFVTLPVPFSTFLEDDWRVEVFLFGDGVNTAAITFITVITEPIGVVQPSSITIYFTALVFVALVIFGFIIPPIHLLAGVAGVALSFQAYNITQEMISSTLLIGLSVILMAMGLTRKFEWKPRR